MLKLFSSSCPRFSFPRALSPVLRALVSLLAAGFMVSCSLLKGYSQPPAAALQGKSSATPSATSSPTSRPATLTPFLPAPITPTPTPTRTLIPSPTPTPTPTPLPPEDFLSDQIRKDITTTTYLTDTCRYLGLRWSPDASPPGTVVLPIMFHSIVQSGHPVSDAKDISAETFQEMVSYSHYLGFKTITTQQLVDFLQNNARIPPLSMLLIFDDRREGVVREHVAPIWNEYDWKITLALISGPVVSDYEWTNAEDLASSGRVDVQAHGYLHNGTSYITSQTPSDIIHQEIYAPIPILKKHFGYRPLAFIWPGGNYNQLAVDMARQAGYQVGFTVESNGPLMFNWIPQSAQDLAMKNPLLVLPRAWSYEANFKLYQASQIAEQAKTYARQNYEAEAAWYQKMCGGTLPPLQK